MPRCPCLSAAKIAPSLKHPGFSSHLVSTQAKLTACNSSTVSSAPDRHERRRCAILRPTPQSLNPQALTSDLNAAPLLKRPTPKPRASRSSMASMSMSSFDEADFGRPMSFAQASAQPSTASLSSHVRPDANCHMPACSEPPDACEVTLKGCEVHYMLAGGLDAACKPAQTLPGHLCPAMHLRSFGSFASSTLRGVARAAAVSDSLLAACCRTLSLRRSKPGA